MISTDPVWGFVFCACIAAISFLGGFMSGIDASRLKSKKTKPKPRTVDEESLIEVLTEMHLSDEGGYPYDYTWVGNVLVVATIDHDNASKIDTYTGRQVRQWIKDANSHIKDLASEGKTCDDAEAFMENAPQPESPAN